MTKLRLSTAPGNAPGCPGSRSTRRRRCAERDFYDYGGACAGAALDHQSAAQHLGPLAHAEQAQPSTAERILGVEACAVVFDNDLNAPCLTLDDDRHMAG